MGYLRTRELLRREILPAAIYIADDIVARGVTRAILEAHPEPEALDIIIQSTDVEKVPHGLPVTYLAYEIGEQAEAALRLLNAQFEGLPGPLVHTCEFSFREDEGTEGSGEVKERIFNEC
jgi:DNA-binding LacI/PurR family transcriptional regulator